MSRGCLEHLSNIQTMARKKCEETNKLPSGIRTHNLLVRSLKPYPLRQPVLIDFYGSLNEVSYTHDYITKINSGYRIRKALLTPTLQPVRDLFTTDFFATDWRSMRLVQPLYAHIRIEDYNRRLVGDRLATGLRLIGDWLP